MYLYIVTALPLLRCATAEHKIINAPGSLHRYVCDWLDPTDKWFFDSKTCRAYMRVRIHEFKKKSLTFFSFFSSNVHL